MSRRRSFIVLAAVGASIIAVAAFSIFRHSPAPSASQAQTLALATFAPPSPPVPPEKQLRATLIDALGYGGTFPWAHRTNLIRSLPANLTDGEADALLTAMMERCPPQVAISLHAAYMHEIACKLQARRNLRESFARALATLARDSQQDDITRDYAVQHLREAWARAEDDAALRTRIVTTFREFTRLDGVLSTGALLSLHLLGSEAADDLANPPRRLNSQSVVSAFPSRGGATPSFLLPDSELIPLVEPILASKSTKENLTARLTAFRIVTERRLVTFRQSLLAALNDPEEHTLLRMAAIHGLAQIADPADLSAMAALKPEDVRLRAALSRALRPRSTP